MHSKTNIPFFETKEEKGRGSRPGQQTTYKNDVISSKIYHFDFKNKGWCSQTKNEELSLNNQRWKKALHWFKEDLANPETIPVT